MYLKSLELIGFKSFAEAKIEFPRGITAVVGPNGTGKSNLVDAILWVLGEQSTKTLRSERMEDVIFNGTESRKPLGMSEVSLVLAGVGDERITGIPGLSAPLHEYGEVMITRRLYRDGQSEYLINKVSCRLKDIRGLLLDTRAGIKGHSVIEQGRIDQILNASPTERRELIEETAGIVRYKKQRAEAIRKLESTQQNLLRVRDIVGEVRRQLNALERQARQARLYRKHQEEARALEIRLLVREARGLLEAHAQIEAKLQGLENQESSEAATESRLTSDIQSARLEATASQEKLDRIRDEVAAVEHQQSQALTAMEVARSRVELFDRQRAQASDDLRRLRDEERTAQGALADVRGRIAETETALGEAGGVLSGLETQHRAVSQQREELSAKQAQARRENLTGAVQATTLDHQVEQLEAQGRDLGRRVESLAAELNELGTQREDAAGRRRAAAETRGQQEERIHQLTGRLADRRAACAELERRLKAAMEEVGRQQEAHAAIESRLAALDSVVREEMGYGRAGQEEATSLRTCEGVRDAVAEWLTVPQGLERAIEAVLGERGRGWLVEDPHRARNAVDLLKTQGLGRGSFIPLRPRWSASQSGAGVPSRAGVHGWAVDLVSARDGAQEVLRCLFHDVLIVDSLEVALQLWSEGTWTSPHGPKLVTLAGEILDAAGVLTGGEAEGSVGLLQRRQEVRALGQERLRIADALAQGRRAHDELQGQVESLAADLKRCEDETHAAEMEVLATRKDEEGLAARLEELDRRMAGTRDEQDRLSQDLRRLQSDVDAKRHELARARQEQSVQEARLAELSGTLAVVEAQGADLQRRVTEGQVKVAALRSTVDHEQANLARLLEGQHQSQAKAAALEQHLADLESAREQSRAEQHRNESLTRELGAKVDRIRAQVVSAQESLAGLQETTRQTEETLGDVRKRLAETRDARRLVEVRRAEIKTQLQTIEQTLTGTYQLAMSDALAHEPHEKERRLQAEEGKTEEEVTATLHEDLFSLRRRLERMGPINLAAIEEHEALEERHRFLSAQEEDLSASIKSLKEIIQRINRTTEQMFAETFSELQQRFGEVFTRLFPGGRAELILTVPSRDQTTDEHPADETGDADEPGVDIVAQPPGKRLKNLAMLSGGEKSLTAIALLFASFLIRITPFCILDEIDAPLDEENIVRFTEVLKELAGRAQCIVITHNKRTMGVADSLFGVTMEDPGVSQLVSIRLAEPQPV